MLKSLAILCAFGLWFYAWYRNDERRLVRDFAHHTPFDGALENCLIRFPSGEMKTDCMLGANSEGLYLSSSTEAIKRNSSWIRSRRHSVIRTPILIPWDRLQSCKARFPLQNYIRFSVPSNKATFFVPRETADLLLNRVGRTVSSV